MRIFSGGASSWSLMAMLMYVGWGVHPANALTRYVDVSCATPTSPYTNWSMASTNIQMAINVATHGDEIWVAPGRYLLGGTRIRITNAVSLRSTQSRAAVIDAQWLSQCMEIYSNNVVVEGFTIQHGAHPSYGGGVYLGADHCVLRDCLIVSNRAWSAGGVMIFRSNQVENCTLQGNLATYWGGGAIFYDGAPSTMRNSIIRDNTASNYAGGVAFQGGGTVERSVIFGNRALQSAGGVEMDLGRIVNSTIYDNHWFR